MGTGLRAVYDDGKRHSEGTVKGMWSSGIVLETDVQPSIGSAVALVVLSGGFDGDRLAAQVAGFEKNALLLDLPGLDPVRWQRLQALVDGKPLTTPLPAGAPGKQPPPNAPVFIISGGEDAQGDPTGVFNLTEDMAKKQAAPEPAPAPPSSSFQIPSPLDPFPFAPAPAGSPATPPPVVTSDEGLEQQVIALGRENAALKNEVQRLSGLKAALEEELKDALDKLDGIEKMMKR